MDGTPLLAYKTPVSKYKLSSWDLAPKDSFLNRQEYLLNGVHLRYNQPQQPCYEGEAN